MSLTYPLITISTRSQVNSAEKQSQLEVAKRIIKEEGVKGLYSYLYINEVELNLH